MEFCLAEGCDFDPDLPLFVPDFPQMDIIMRTTGYVSDDLWESKFSPIVSCTWMYAYSVIPGKANHIMTGFYHDLRCCKVYPTGLWTISVPYQKPPEFFAVLGKVDWTMVVFYKDVEGKRELQH